MRGRAAPPQPGIHRVPPPPPRAIVQVSAYLAQDDNDSDPQAEVDVRDAILSLTAGNSLYSCSFGVLLLRCMLRALRSILVYVPLRDFSWAKDIVQLSQPS